jgi:signal transduction histidine kinase
MSSMTFDANTESPPPLPGTARILTHRQLIGSRLYLHTWIRLIVALSIIAGAAVAEHMVGIEGLPTRGLVILGLLVAAYNSGAWFIARRHRQRERLNAPHSGLLWVMNGAIVLDYLSLTAAIWLVGGARSPFLAFYLPHVIVSHVNLSRRAAMSFTVLAYGLISLLVTLEWLAIAPPCLPTGAVIGAGPLDGRYAVTVLVVYALLFILVSILLAGLTREYRRGERRIRLANAELMRLSEMRKDFLQTALHNLKSPLGAVTMFLDNLKGGLGGPVTEKQVEWIERSLTRIKGLTEFLKSMQTLSSISAGMIEAEAKEVDLAPLLEDVVEENQDLAAARDHTLTLEIPRALPPVIGFARLLREAVANYITNAIKYTANGGTITVRAFAREAILRVEVEDNGPGISEEDTDKLFQEFVRLAKKGLPASKEKGSGLGLSIVKRIAEGQGGRAGVESELGKGSVFFMELPLA